MVYKSLIGMSLVMTSLVSAPANAAVVYWEPTNLDVNYTNITLDTGFSLGMLDVDDFDGLQIDALIINAAGDSVEIVASGGDFIATSAVTSNSITLFNDNQFVIALQDDNSGEWFEPVSWSEVVSNTNLYDITFSNGMVLSIDAVPTVVPIPAAVWLFGSGLLGLVGIARRKA